MDLGLMGLGEIDPQTLLSINVAYDGNGYVYDVATGNYVDICYDSQSQPYECTSGVRILNIDSRFFNSQKKPKTDYMPYLLIGGAALLLLTLTAKR